MVEFSIYEIQYLSNPAVKALEKYKLINYEDFAGKEPWKIFAAFVKKNGQPSEDVGQALMNAFKIITNHIKKMDEGRKKGIRSLMKTFTILSYEESAILYDSGLRKAADFMPGEMHDYDKAFRLYDQVCSRVDLSAQDAPMIWEALLALCSLMQDDGPGGSTQRPPG